MKTTIGLACLLMMTGGLMEDNKKAAGNEWVTVRDEKTGLQVDFPHEPIEMSFEIPFQNTPPKGTVRLYSVPGPKGLFVLGTFKADEMTKDWLSKEKLSDFLNHVLAPHFFYDPAVFRNEQIFGYRPKEVEGNPGALFQIFYLDHETEKQVEGYATVRDRVLYIYFYLSSVHDFDHERLKRFVNSVKFPGISLPTKEIPFDVPKAIE